MEESFSRVVIENVSPQIDQGAFPVKRAVGESIDFSADIFSDSVFSLGANLLWRKKEEKQWNRLAMQSVSNDSWTAQLTFEEVGLYYYTIEAWIDYFMTWLVATQKKIEVGSFNFADLHLGIEILEKSHSKEFDPSKIIAALKKISSEKELSVYLNNLEIGKKANRAFALDSLIQFDQYFQVRVKRKRSLFSTWYEFFPRSSAEDNSHGTFADCINHLPRIAEMGFDVIYFPPIHPIGKAARKGANNSLVSPENAVGSPWAIGGKEGGHDAIHPELGDLASFKKLIKKASELGMEIALDLAFQCSPDHPYLKSNPQWFLWRSDGTVQHAENPPKKYEDIVPFYFETEDWQNLWLELKRVVVHWIDQGVKIFRVDNPHTKPFAFWEWLIQEIFNYDPNVLFLSEAFTRPKVMYRLAKIGFDQSYTYFTWRNTKHELESYVKELVYSDLREYFRPNFWPNTPDILSEALQYGGRSAFIARYVLAATLSSNCGIYGPAYELTVNQALAGKEEYLDSEKFEVKSWDYQNRNNISELIALINRIRKEYTAFQTTWNVEFVNTENDSLIGYIKQSLKENEPSFLIIVNLDYYNAQSGMVNLPLHKLDLHSELPYLVEDQITKDKYVWTGPRNYIKLNPHAVPVHILKVYKELRRENNFDYFI